VICSKTLSLFQRKKANLDFFLRPTGTDFTAVAWNLQERKTDMDFVFTNSTIYLNLKDRLSITCSFSEFRGHTGYSKLIKPENVAGYLRTTTEVKPTHVDGNVVVLNPPKLTVMYDN